MRTVRSTHQTAAVLAVLALAAVTGCGSSDSGTTAPQSAAAGAAVSLKPYVGADEQYFGALTVPPAQAGKPFSFGYLDPYAAIPGLLATEKGFCAQVKDLGGTCITKDANVSVQTQVSQFNELLAQGVQAIGISPLDPGALAPSLTAATGKKVPVVTAEAPPDVTQPAIPGVTANVSQALDYSAWATMSEVAKAMPGTHFGVLGTASPNPLLRYLLAREQYWAVQQGLVLDGKVDAQQDNPAAWATAGTTLAQKFPSMKVMVSYNDSSAVAALNAVKAAGRTDVKVADANGYQGTAKAAIKDGGMVASYAIPWDQKGRAMAIAAYSAYTGIDYPKIIGIKGQVVTKANVDTVTPVG